MTNGWDDEDGEQGTICVEGPWLSQQLAEIHDLRDAARTKRDEATELDYKADEQLSRFAALLFDSFGEAKLADKQDIADKLYWNFEFSTTWIGRALNLKPSQLRELAGFRNYECPVCNHQAKVRTRTELQEFSQKHQHRHDANSEVFSTPRIVIAASIPDNAAQQKPTKPAVREELLRALRTIERAIENDELA